MNHPNHKIVEHLRQRFKTRHGVELTKKKRMMLLDQIHSKIGRQLFVMRDGSELWRVRLYDQATYSDKSYTVMYNRNLTQITTVLPNIDSEEFEAFIKRSGISREQIMDRQLTSQERLAKSVRKAIEVKKENLEAQQINEGNKRLKEYKALRNYFKK